MKSLQRFLLASLAVLCVASAASAADASPAGIWKWTVQGRQGRQGFEQTLKLDYRDGKLTGTMLGMQGGQFTVPDTAISEASLKDGVIKFTLTREFNDRKFTTKYEGKLEGDAIKGTYESSGFGGGEAVKREWNARRRK